MLLFVDSSFVVQLVDGKFFTTVSMHVTDMCSNDDLMELKNRYLFVTFPVHRFSSQW